MEKTGIQIWYDQNRARYEDLASTLETLIKTLLKEEKVLYHSVNSRVKDRDGCAEKFVRKEYASPEQVMDIAGLRIITYTTAEVDRVRTVIEREFDIDLENSGDKAEEMGVDKVGYLSVHYIVKLKADRVQLKEYARFEGLCCEIQVRSLLQHAWAEIEHDRSYKFTGKLPESLQRKFYLLAGTLELMDQEFCALSQEIDQYAAYVKEQSAQGQVGDIRIDSTSLLQFLNEFFKNHDTEQLAEFYHSNSGTVIEELSCFGIETLQQLKNLLGKKTAEEWTADKNVTYIGILRDAMILSDPKRYFKDAWQRHWLAVPVSSLENWEKLGVDMEKLHACIRLKKNRSDDFIIEAK